MATLTLQIIIIVLLTLILLALIAYLWLERGQRQKQTTPLAYATAPQPLAQQFLEIVRVNLAVEEGWLFFMEGDGDGKMIWQPLAGMDDPLPQSVVFAGESHFMRQLIQERTPRFQADFDDLPVAEKEIIANWQHVLYLPLHDTDSLVAVLALGQRATGEPYRRQDIAFLQSLAAQFAPLLAQAQNLVALQKINAALLDDNRQLMHTNQQYAALAAIQGQFLKLITPELKRPLPTLYQQLEQPSVENPDTKTVDQLKNNLEQLISIAHAIQKQSHFNFAPIRVEEIVEAAIDRLRTTIEARRVTISFRPQKLPPLVGDREKLVTAVANILHNAVKFNRLGGEVTITTHAEENEVKLAIHDTGVGIPDERLEALWNGFTGETQQFYNRSKKRQRIPMGLTLAHFIVQAHSGRLTASSNYGSGSVFTIYLPFVE